MFLSFLRELLRNRHIMAELTKNDFRKKYLGSSLGIIWAFIHPTIYIMIVWFVFQVGFNSQPMDNFPFVLWMLAGIIPWFFFSECLGGASNIIIENAFLVKKVAFSTEILPLIKILSSLIIHFFFIIVIFFSTRKLGNASFPRATTTSYCPATITPTSMSAFTTLRRRKRL